MSTLQYIEFSSAYRDRLTWKNPAEFEIKFESTKQTPPDLFTAVNPKSGAYPYFGWHGLPVRRRTFGFGGNTIAFNQVWPPLFASVDGVITATQWGIFVGGTKSAPILGIIRQQASGVGSTQIVQADSVYQSGGNSWQPLPVPGGAVPPPFPTIFTPGITSYFDGALLARLQQAGATGKVSLIETSRISSFNGTTGQCTLVNPFTELNVSTELYCIIFDQNVTLTPTLTGVLAPAQSGVPFNAGGQNTNPTQLNYNPNPTLFINGGTVFPRDHAFTDCVVEDITITQNGDANPPGGPPTQQLDTAGTTYDPASLQVLNVIPATATISSYNGITKVATLSNCLGGATTGGNGGSGVLPTGNGPVWYPAPPNVALPTNNTEFLGCETHNYIIRCDSQPLIRGCVSCDSPAGTGLYNSTNAGGLGIPNATGQNSAIGCVYSFTVIDGGFGFIVGLTNATVGPGNGLLIRAISGGGTLDNFNCEIANPGFTNLILFPAIPSGGYGVGDFVTVSSPVAGGDAQILITGTGFGIDLSFSAPLLPALTNYHRGQIFYIPSRYPVNGNVSAPVAAASGTSNVYPGTVPVAYEEIPGNRDSTDYGPDWPNNVTYGGTTMQTPVTVATDLNPLINNGYTPASDTGLGITYDYGNAGCATRRWKSTVPKKLNNSSKTVPETGTRNILGYFFSQGDNGAGAALNVQPAIRSVVVSEGYNLGFSTSIGLVDDSVLPVQTPNTALPSHTYFEILPFQGDQWNPLIYSGSRVSQNQLVCCEVVLNSLILPNQTLTHAPGGTIAFYPFVYVELINKTSPSGGTQNIITSNNPNANRAVFKVPIKDIPQKVLSQFIKLDGVGQIQTIKFKPNDTFYFRVYFGNGDTFETVETDFAPPLKPEDEVQISALFGFKRL